MNKAQMLLSEANALAKVAKEHNQKLCKIADKLLVEYIQAGGRFAGTEFGKQFGMFSKDGGDFGGLIKSLVTWLERESDPNTRSTSS